MKIRFWGTRGSLPTPLNAPAIKAKVRQALQLAQGQDLSDETALDRFLDDEIGFDIAGTFGGNTSCVQIDDPDIDEYLIMDAGTGIRDFGNHVMAKGGGKPATFHIFFSHVHWDHIQGFPFFTPAYIPGNRIVLHSHHEPLEETMVNQLENPNFPVPITMMNAYIEFDVQPPGTGWEVGGFKISTIAQKHPGVSYGYRFEKNGKVFVYSSDSEHKDDFTDDDYPFVKFFRNADVVVFDAQYSLAEATALKEDWGHSSNMVGVELASRAKVKNLCLFHNEPMADDAQLAKVEASSNRYAKLFNEDEATGFPQRVFVAYDSLELDI